jgi:hypothetical protein
MFPRRGGCLTAVMQPVVIAVIYSESEDDRLRFWTFIRYMAVHHPSILGVTLDAAVQERCDSLLSRLELPPVTLRRVRTPEATDDS